MTRAQLCRFCGTALGDEDSEFHFTCVVAAHDDDHRPKGSDAHPMYGSKPGA